MPARTRPPNILFVFSDQQRWCSLGCYGNADVISPHLDAFARDAVQFTHCISNSPVCVPARGTLLTGLFPLRHGAVANDLPIRHDVTSVAHVLQSRGYHTGYIGKWHLAGVPRDQSIAEGPARLGFMEWKVCNCNHHYLKSYYDDEANRRIEIPGYEPEAQTALAVEFIRRNEARGPWALTLSWGPPHDPYDELPDRYLERYRGRDFRLRPNVPETVRLTRTLQLAREHVLADLRGYYAHVTALDEQFGRLMTALEETGQVDNTLVVFTSDHGDMLGSQGLTNKQLPYDESIRVPLLARWPGHTRMGLCDELIGLVDLPTSVLGFTGLRFPGAVDGRDLHALFTTPGARGLEACYIFDLIPCHQAWARGDREWRGLRTPRFTLARSASDEGTLLFDNVADPFQMRNLIHDPARDADRRELLAQLDGFIQAHDALLPWEDLIRRYHLKESWNRSQAYFRLPLME
ncbi:MAG: sulfatase [Planctomycetes bacterium]|nr:sulfatase [Planctomycetota bacterium]